MTSSSRLTVSSLLDRLTALHDTQQKERKKEWDTYLRSRKAKAKGKVSSGNQQESTTTGTGMIGVGQMGRGEEWKAFARLVRAGVPLAYRSDIWAGAYIRLSSLSNPMAHTDSVECSGALDMMVPGEYAEIQNVHQHDSSPFIAEIEKDVTRTFPGNVFFGQCTNRQRYALHTTDSLGGDGPGVAKLRRVLVAYSW
jgi:hypothetical protein